ncbi:ATP-binding protein [Streptomyces nodosus]|uniref:ATP-binding protein n=2 Tax=Streptomyces nodosus TaxID=40318 RepID=A0A5P2W891_9ACTN|nr:ATP-binding protein [Streptomyces nodosus]
MRSATLSDVNQEIAEPMAPPATTLPHFTVLLSSTRRGARLARLLAEAQLRRWGLPTKPADLLVAELAANAVTHGRVPGRDFRLTLYVIGGTLRIEVTDTRGDRLPALQRPSGDDESGRGLLLVDALADRWGVAEDRFPRKRVWAELRCASPAPGPTDSGAPDSPALSANDRTHAAAPGRE